MVRALPLFVVLAAAASAQEAPVVGWRNDGSGRYPAAAPPLTWGRSSASIRSLRLHAANPPEGAAGAPMADGVLREWLVLTPPPGIARVDKEMAPEEGRLDPAENEKLGDGAWKKVSLETAWLDFQAIHGKVEKGVGVAVTHVYSPTGGRFVLAATQLGGFRLVLNGKVLPSGYGRYGIDLVKGWNRLLVKAAVGEGGWACTLALQARAPAEFEETNLAWRTPLPGVSGGFYGGGMGCGAPIVAGDRIYLLSEPHDLVCLSKADGKVLWVRTNSFFDAATEEDRRKPGYPDAEATARKLNDLNALLASGPLSAKQLEEKSKLEGALSATMQELDPVRYRKYETPDVGFSGFTPVFDGTHLYLWFGNGVTACYDRDGRRIWIRADPLPAVEHGFSSSPLLIDGKVIVFMRDLFAFDARTGAQAWRIPVVAHQGANPGGYFHGTPVGVVRGGVPLIVLGNGTIVRAADGQVLFTHPEMGNQAISSPVIDGPRLLETGTSSMKLFIHALPDEVTGPFKMATRIVSVATAPHPYYYMPWHMASPVVHEGLAYLLNNAGVLTVVDLAEAKVVYQRMVDLDHFQTSNEGAARGIGISPAIAGGKLVLMGNNGSTLVLEPGRTFKVLAKNRIESVVSIGHWGERQERFVSNPVFDGNRIYLRGEGHLYAIEAGRSSTSRSSEASKVADRPAAGPKPSPVAVPEVPEADVIPSTVFGWRRDGTGHFPDAAPPLTWGAGKNVRWQAKVGKGPSSPIVAGDRVFVLSEPGTLLCLDRATGDVSWKAELPPGRKDNARATPVTDGHSVFVALANGVVAGFSVDGKRRWLQNVEPAVLTYGPSASPILAGDRLLVDSTHLTALDPATGKVLWKASDGEAHYGTPAVLSVGGVLVAVTAKGAVIRVSDGAVLATSIAPDLGGDQSPTPVARGGMVYFAYRKCSAVKLSFDGPKLRAEKRWDQELPGDVISSPILHEGLLYVVPSGSPDVRVLNAATGEVVAEKNLDLAPMIYPSLARAGKHLFLGNDRGETLIFEIGRDLKPAGHNELPDGSGASPVFAGSHLYLRGGEVLYCIGP